MMSFFRRPQLPPFVQAYHDAPRPDGRLPWREVPYTVLDVETSGLNARRDALLAIGLVEITGGRVVLERSWHTLVRPPDGLEVPGDSISIHGLLRAELAAAPPTSAVLPELLRLLTGRVLVVHVAAVDVTFLNAALRRAYGTTLRGPALDTALLARHLQGDRLSRPFGQTPPPLHLRALAEEAGLPAYAEHDALADAITTAQLFLVQATRLAGRGRTTLRDLLRVGGCLR